MMNDRRRNHLHAVGDNLPEPPYPEDTKVKGWRFEIDFERIKRSDTWALSPPEMRPWLLMIWTVTWDQHPPALPNDYELIAARIGMEFRAFKANADILLRGYTLHSDQRLYHPVVTERVSVLLDLRDRKRRNVEAYRERQKAKSGPDVTGYTPAGNRARTAQEQEQEQELDVKENPPSGDKRKTAKPAPEPPDPPGLNAQAWRDYVAHRRAIKARALKPASVTRLKAWLANQGPPDTQAAIVDTTIRNGWTGLFEQKGAGRPKQQRNQQIDEAVDRWLGKTPDDKDREPIQGDFTRE